ncbi:MAG: MFS transporter [Ferrovibrio sp.]|uniref:MFS transporter n=1 Tax=Ferrovibrio sp. TaxID=1917215 RepID=UPI00263797E2|nr:MFS transporter [Ferrovibrio sp.]MCW0233633.1 MFS transporter [Ferrovibrio sp.]
MPLARRVISYVNIAHLFDHMFMLIFPTAVLAMEADFGRSYGELLALSIGGFIAFGAGSIPSGWLGDTWSRRSMLGVFFIGIGAAAIFAGSTTSLWMLAVALTLIGLFASIYHPVGTAMLTAHAESLSAEKLGRELGTNGVWGNVGVACAALITGAIAQFLGWRFAFIIPGLVSIGCGIAYLLMVPDHASPPRKGKPQVKVPRAIAIRAFAVLAVVGVSGGVVFNAATIALPKLFSERMHDLIGTPVGISLLVFVVYLAGAMAQLIIGRLVDRYTLKQIFVAVSFLQAPCLLLAGFTDSWWLILPCLGVMFAVFGQVTINDTMVARYTSDEWRARAFSLRYLLSFGASAMAVPLIALVYDRGGGFDTLFGVLAVLGLSIFLSALVFPGGSPTEAAREADVSATSAMRSEVGRA